MTSHVEIPEVVRLGPNHWQVRWAARHPFEVDDRVFSQIVRSLPKAAQRQLFERLSDTLAKRRKSFNPVLTTQPQAKEINHE